jgi:hypothetical protein
LPPERRDVARGGRRRPRRAGGPSRRIRHVASDLAVSLIPQDRSAAFLPQVPAILADAALSARIVPAGRSGLSSLLSLSGARKFGMGESNLRELDRAELRGWQRWPDEVSLYTSHPCGPL